MSFAPAILFRAICGDSTIVAALSIQLALHARYSPYLLTSQIYVRVSHAESHMQARSHIQEPEMTVRDA